MRLQKYKGIDICTRLMAYVFLAVKCQKERNICKFVFTFELEDKTRDCGFHNYNCHLHSTCSELSVNMGEETKGK
jgi:hypothetical protein